MSIIYSCKDLDIFTENQTLYLRKKMARKNMKTKEPLDDEIKPEEPLLLKQSVNLLLEENIITKKELIEKFQLPNYELEKLCNLPKNFLNIKDNVIPLRIKKDK